MLKKKCFQFLKGTRIRYAADIAATFSNGTETERTAMNVRWRPAHRSRSYVDTFWCTEFAFVRGRNVNGP